jgi:hypothetical protein
MPSLGPRAASNSLYWKFNSSLLADPNFLPAFRAMWLPLAAARPLPPAPDPIQPDPDPVHHVVDVPVPAPVPPLPLQSLPWCLPPLLLACPCPWTRGPFPSPDLTQSGLSRIRTCLNRIRIHRYLLLFWIRTLTAPPFRPRCCYLPSPPSPLPTSPPPWPLLGRTGRQGWPALSTLQPRLSSLPSQPHPLPSPPRTLLPLHLDLDRTWTPPRLRRPRTGGTWWPSRPSSPSASATRPTPLLAAFTFAAWSADPWSWPWRPRTGLLWRPPEAAFAPLMRRLRPASPSALTHL